MSAQTVKLGLIGAGVSCWMYKSAAQHLAGFEIVAAADPKPEALKTAQEILGTRRSYATVEAMLAAGGLDGVIIASPPFCHLEHVQTVASRGVAVFCEKPMARTVAEATQMVDACRQAGVLFMVGFNRRFLSPLWTATEMIKAGDLGEVFATECNWTSWTALSGGGWRDSARCLGGVFQDHGAHSIDLATQWLGHPASSVFAQARRIGPRIGGAREVEDHMSALVTHANGATSSHVHSRVSHRPVSELYRILGTKGTLELEYTGDWSFLAPDAWEMRLYRDGGQRPQHLVAFRPDNELMGVISDGAYGYYAELKRFAEAVRAGHKAASPAGTEGLAVVEAVSAAFLSAAENRVVLIAEACQFDEGVFKKLFL